MEAIKEALTFDDVLLLPRFSNILPSETDISLNLSGILNSKPHFYHQQWTLLQNPMAIAIAKLAV